MRHLQKQPETRWVGLLIRGSQVRILPGTPLFHLQNTIKVMPAGLAPDLEALFFHRCREVSQKQSFRDNMRPWHCGSLPPLCVVSESRADDLALIRHRIGPERVLDHRQKSTFGSCSSSTRWTSEGLSGTWLSENDAKALKDALHRHGSRGWPSTSSCASLRP